MTAPIALNGTVAGVTISDVSVHFRLVDLNHNPTLEGANHPMFMFEEAFWHSGYGHDRIEANAIGLCMNRMGQVGNEIDDTLEGFAQYSGPTKGGWKSCYMRNTVLPQLLQACPIEWQTVITPTTIYSDNVGVANGGPPKEISATQDTLYLMSVCEVFGADYVQLDSSGEVMKLSANPDEAKYQTQIKYFANGHIRYCTYMSSSMRIEYTLRSVYGLCFWRCVATSGSLTTAYSAYPNYGVRPVFKI